LLLYEDEYVNAVRSQFFPANPYVVFQIGIVSYTFGTPALQQIHASEILI